jgi:1-acyl-sn-glycerol-3-phosphate acyltransferase
MSKTGKRINLFYWFIWSLLRVFLRVYCRIKITGAKKVPRKGGFILASNHIGAGDPFFVGTCVTREFKFMAKQELFKNPIIGNLISWLNAFPVNRGILDPKALQTAYDTLHAGYGLILFPEGTRSKTGELGKGKPGVGLLARRMLVPIVPAYIENSRGFSSIPISLRRMKVIFGDPIPSSRIEEFLDTNDGYRALSEDLMQKIGELQKAMREKL